MLDVFLLLLLASVTHAAELRGVLDGSFLNLEWDALDGKLQEAATPEGPWQTVTTAVCPHRTPTTSARKFYRLILPAPGKKWLTVAAVTMTAQTNTAANLQTFFYYMEQAASNGVDLVVFPEIALQQCPGWGPPSYYPTAQEMAYVQQTAEMIPGQSTSNVVAKAAELNLFVIFGMTEKDAAELLYNTSVLLGPEGVLGKHRKRYLADSSRGGNEHRIWSAGQVWDVVESPLGKVGLMICVEMGYYPGPVLANQGADLLVTSSGWPIGFDAMWHDFTTGNASRANRWHVVSNQFGAAGHFYDCGHSRVIDPKGTIVCDTEAMEGLVMWATDILIDARTP